MGERQSTDRIEQLMAEMDAGARRIEQRGKKAAAHLRVAAAKRRAAAEGRELVLRVRVIGASDQP